VEAAFQVIDNPDGGGGPVGLPVKKIIITDVKAKIQDTEIPNPAHFGIRQVRRSTTGLRCMPCWSKGLPEDRGTTLCSSQDVKLRWERKAMISRTSLE
jgi:hypothetical protein